MLPLAEIILKNSLKQVHYGTSTVVIIFAVKGFVNFANLSLYDSDTVISD